jgi:hypothetical protein
MGDAKKLNVALQELAPAEVVLELNQTDADAAIVFHVEPKLTHSPLLFRNRPDKEETLVARPPQPRVYVITELLPDAVHDMADGLTIPVELSKVRTCTEYGYTSDDPSHVSKTE